MAPEARPFLRRIGFSSHCHGRGAPRHARDFTLVQQARLGFIFTSNQIRSEMQSVTHTHSHKLKQAGPRRTPFTQWNDLAALTSGDRRTSTAFVLSADLKQRMETVTTHFSTIFDDGEGRDHFESLPCRPLSSRHLRPPPIP